ncbi:MAG: hypothetical protein Kow0029_02410 [Candidatus Rifleibacteriota bacterium]
MTGKTSKTIDQFIHSLKNSPSGPIFNPWWQTDPENDDYSNAPEVRRYQLMYYLKERMGRTRYLLIGEALGYQGGHFTGIAMTSERILLGNLVKKGIKPEHVFTTLEPARTSKASVRKDGFSEPTATIVWGHLLELGIDPYDFTIWNALPWHPYQQSRGLLSNRTPTQKEFELGLERLQDLIRLMKPQQIVAVGEKAAVQLDKIGLKHQKVRHPANGGAGKFREQFAALLNAN